MVMIVEQLVERMSGKGNRNTRRKPAPGPLCPPQIPHDLIRAAAVGGWRPTSVLRRDHILSNRWDITHTRFVSFT
jgi:hypothetical protein